MASTSPSRAHTGQIELTAPIHPPRPSLSPASPSPPTKWPILPSHCGLASSSATLCWLASRWSCKNSLLYPFCDGGRKHGRFEIRDSKIQDWTREVRHNHTRHQNTRTHIQPGRLKRKQEHPTASRVQNPTSNIENLRIENRESHHRIRTPIHPSIAWKYFSHRTTRLTFVLA
jgi:hypothetical protein